MNQLLLRLYRLLLQALLLLGLYFLSRLMFTLINLRHFSGLGILQFLRLSFFGIRYDLSAICTINILYIVLFFLPLPIWKMPRWDKALQVLFIITNSLGLLFDIGDWAYYPYNFKRATSDVLRLISTKGDFWSVLPDYALSYWYVPLAAVVAILALLRLNKLVCKRVPLNQGPEFGHFNLFPFWQTVSLIIICGCCIIGIRGGLQYIPIGLRNAVQVTENAYVPIVLNTPFSIISTLTTPALEEHQFMDPIVAKKLMPFTHQYPGNTFTKRNVVLLIIESGSSEFTSLGKGPSFTPFLDSLMQHSLVCTQAYANGQTSAEGIPAVTAGIPTLMEEAFTTSNYGTNRITSLPGILKPLGYESAFYHGGTNGTMSFDVFTSSAGFDHYYGRSEYHNEADYDGAWGIYDIPFLQYAMKGCSAMKAPFLTTIFTLSSHPPYNLPEPYKKSLPTGPLAVQQCIAYTDKAIQQFFEGASKQAWFNNTLFVITADHCSPENSGGYYGQGLGRFRIPIVFYAPGDSSLKGRYDQPVQQLDILPSVLQYMGYPQPFFAFGNSIFNTQEPRQVITYTAGSYQWLENSLLLQTKALQPEALFRYPADSLGQQNIMHTDPANSAQMIKHLQAFIQRYEEVLIHNSMH